MSRGTEFTVVSGFLIGLSIACTPSSPPGEGSKPGAKNYLPAAKTKPADLEKEVAARQLVGEPRVRISLKGHTGRVTSLAFSPDGETLASGGYDSLIRLWNPTTGKELAALKGHTHYVWSVAFSPDGRVLASGSSDKTIKLWDVETGRERATLRGHTHGVNSVSWAPDGKTLASRSSDGTVKLWDTTTGKERSTLKGNLGVKVISVGWSPDGKTLASGGGPVFGPGELKLWNTTTGKEQTSLQGHRQWVLCVRWSPDGKSLASAGCEFEIYGARREHGTVKIWDLATGTVPMTLEGHKSSAHDVSWSPDGKTLASGGGLQGEYWVYPGEIKLWDVATGKLRATLKEPTGVVLCVTWSPDGKSLASGGGDETVRLWDLHSAK